MHNLNPSAWHVDIDKYLNRLVPPNFIHTLPRPISHFLGYRESPQADTGNILVAFWACLGAFVGVIVLEGVFMIPEIRHRGPPLLIASFGAVAILEYNTIESPLAQPRNSIIGHVLSTAIGIGITKLFTLTENFEDYRWLAGGLACGASSGVMTLTKTIYPPAGATALLAAIDPTVQQLGWYLLPLVLLSTVLTLVTSLLLNNIQRRYPTYWWTPVDLTRRKRRATRGDVEKMAPSAGSSSPEKYPQHYEHFPAHTILITPDRIVVPNHILLAFEEKGMLEILRNRLGQGLRRIPESATIAWRPDHAE
ncbi:MAG: hypothetical protein Q9217_001418 [Psora testacea]